MTGMTGYAYKEEIIDNLSIYVEIKSYNSRFLEIKYNIPALLSKIENNIKEKINTVCKRGNVDVNIRIKESNIPVNIKVNTEIAKIYYKKIKNLALRLGIRKKPDLPNILQLEGIIEIEKNFNTENYWQKLEPIINEVLEKLKNDKIREGKITEKDILNYISNIEKNIDIISNHALNLEEIIKNNIKKRFNEIIGNNIDENRIITETAVLLLKYSISEELTRLNLHINEFKKEIKENNGSGKKLDFLCQEINREINTIGSKSSIFEINIAVVNIKESLENIREQLRNVE